MTDVGVRAATADELASVLGILDGAALETDADRVRAGIERGDVLVAVPGEPAGESDDSGTRTPVGALVLDGDEIANVAVRRRRRGQGIGTALVEAATDRREVLVAECDADVAAFYESLGFDLTSLEGGRCRGRRDE